MNTRAVAMIVISIAIGLAAVFAAAQWVSRQGAVSTAKVVVAKRDLAAGTRLTPEMLQLIDWPAASMVKGAITELKLLEARVVNSNVQQGEPVLESKLAASGSKGGLSSVITEGRRAITVKVNEVVGVAGFPYPGDRVDIMVNTQDEQNKPISKIVLEQIPVLAVAQDLGAKNDDSRPRVVSAVTLEVTPAQAETLDLARSVGSLSLVMRNLLDRASVATVGIGKNDLLDNRRTRPPAPTEGARAAAPPAAKAPAVTRNKVNPAARVDTTPPAAPITRIEIIRGVTPTQVDYQRASE